MKFPVEALSTARNREKLLEIIKFEVCDSCLGRQFGMLGHGLTNAERGEILRKFASDLTKSKIKEPAICKLCKNFFKDEINGLARSIVKKLQKTEFNTFLIGSIVASDVARRQDELWEKSGIEDVETIKSEINRELGKRIEKLADKKFKSKNPDVTVLVDLNTNKITVEVRSLYVFGKYQKLVRGIPQSKWVCLKCGGKGCINCKGLGQLYPTSVQEIIDKPLLKVAGSKKSKFSAHGREDIDARCLDYRPFVIELLKPVKRKIDLKKLEKQVNKSKKVKVKLLKLADKEIIRKLKSEKIDKTYRATVEFEKAVDKKKLKELRQLLKEPILQKTPLRVVHRRADIFRKRKVKKISWKLLAKKKMQLTIKGETGLYIKELITGDQGRTKPNISELLGNKVKRIELDIIKIHD